MRHILILFFCLFIGSLYGQIVRVDSTVIYESRSIYNQAGYYIGKDSFHVKQVRLAYCNDTFYERNDTLIQRFPQQFITTDSVDADITEVNVTNYLTGGGSSGAVTIGIDTSGTVGVATKYDVSDKIDGIGSVHYVPKFSDGNTLTDSRIYDDGDNNVIQIGNGSTEVNLDYLGGKAVNIANEGTIHTTIKGISTSSTQNGTIITHNIDDEMGLIGGSYDGYYIDLGGSGYSTISTATEGVFINKINTSSTESNLLTLKNDGKVGIGGVTEPSATLHVDGTLKVTSQTGTPTKILGVDASGNVGEVGKGFGISVSGGDVLVDTNKIATQYDLSQVGGGSGDITEVTVTNYLTGGGTSGAVSIGMDTTGTVGVATKYDLKDFQTGAQVRDSIGILDANHDGIVDEAEDSGRLGGSNGSYYLSRANHTGTQDTSTITGLGEFVEDRAGAKIVAGTGITTSYNDATGETTINATGSGDITAVNVSGYLTGGGTSGDVTIGVDTTGTVGLATKYDLTTSGGGLSAEEVRDTVAAMFTTGSSITWNETDSADSIFLDVNLNPLETMVQGKLLGRWQFHSMSQMGTNLIGGFGFPNTVTGSTTNPPNIATTNFYQKRVKLPITQGTASTTNVVGLRGNNSPFLMEIGFVYSFTFGQHTGTSNTSKRAFVGVRSSTANVSDVSPTTLTNMFGFGWDDALDNNVQFYHNDGSGTPTQIDLGSSWAIPTTDESFVYTVLLYVPNGGTTVYYKIINDANGTSESGSVTSNIPSTSTVMNPYNYMSVGGVSSVIGMGFFHLFGQYMDNY